MNKRNLNIVKLYSISLSCIVCFFLLDNSDIIPELVEKANKLRYKGFPTFLITGLFKYGLLVIGISIIIILNFILIKRRISKYRQKTC